MTDLVSGRYSPYNPFWLMTGKLNNEVQADVPVQSNVPLLKYSTCADAALAGATEEGSYVAVPVSEGSVISSVTFLIGATAGKLAEAGYAALYAGKSGGKLLAQSKTKAYSESIKAAEAFKFTLEKAVLITPENAPSGYVYVVLALEAETIPTVVSSPCPKLTQDYEEKKSWFTGGPLGWSGKVGTGLKGTAEATLGTTTSGTNIPWVFLR